MCRSRLRVVGHFMQELELCNPGREADAGIDGDVRYALVVRPALRQLPVTTLPINHRVIAQRVPEPQAVKSAEPAAQGGVVLHLSIVSCS